VDTGPTGVGDGRRHAALVARSRSTRPRTRSSRHPGTSASASSLGHRSLCVGSGFTNIYGQAGPLVEHVVKASWWRPGVAHRGRGAAAARTTWSG
jgi:hypothetical protein